ncbi:Uncharacterized protein C16C4.16c [Colletotrichum chlorophyti]|uniref:Uncharacterized protein C16C4.16c n=1 Tax=Colletotrichum chlorophyti TaxID=708187 RepID=A0A1Q8S7Y8_9PEZI|nr:Uncharacterized protein C16C4.16c [Colletotrichum chlorophyti]
MDWDMDMDDVAEGFAPPGASIGETAAAAVTTNDRDLENTTLVPNKIHIRGLDTLTTDDIKKYVRDHYGPADRVEWIDDESANLIFGSSSTAQEAIKALSAIEIADATQLPPQETIPAKPIASKPEINLQVRFAVLSDKKAPGAASRSRFYLFHPEFDPEERRRREGTRSRYRDREGDDRYRRNDRGRRSRDRSVEVFDAGMYDDDEAALAEREERTSQHRRRSRSRDSESRREPSYTERNRLKELFPNRQLGSNSRSRSQRNRSASPARDVDGDAKMDRETERAGTARNRERASGIRDRLSKDNSSKELFPAKGPAVGRTHMDRVMDSADETARLMQRNMSVSNDQGQKRDLFEGRVKGTSGGFSIKGAAGANVKELFPDRFDGNSGKELFANKLEGRGRRRQKAEDLFS